MHTLLVLSKGASEGVFPRCMSSPSLPNRCCSNTISCAFLKGTTQCWRWRFRLRGAWVITSSRCTYPAYFWSCSVGSCSGWGRMTAPVDWPWASPLYWPLCFCSVTQTECFQRWFYVSHALLTSSLSLTSCVIVKRASGYRGREKCPRGNWEQPQFCFLIDVLSHDRKSETSS